MWLTDEELAAECRARPSGARVESRSLVRQYESAPPDAPTSNGAWTPHSNQTKGGRTS
jgi:hypothetical protein